MESEMTIPVDLHGEIVDFQICVLMMDEDIREELNNRGLVYDL